MYAFYIVLLVRMNKVLIIEDKIELLEEIAEILTFEDYKVFKALNGHEGLISAQHKQPDFILCDIMMPKVDGFEVLKKVRNSESMQTIPFIFITALSERINFRKGMELGADDYLTKPFSREELLSILEVQKRKSLNIENQIKNRVLKIENELNNKLLKLNEEKENNEGIISYISNRNELLANQLKEKEIELMKETFRAIEINNIVQELSKIIQSKFASVDKNTPYGNLIAELKEKINSKTILWNNWTIFQIKFSQVYPNFISRVKKKYDNLTQYELVFISATFLGLTTQQIADLLNITDDSVRKSRYRLKRKIGLGKDEDFLKFIYSLNAD